MTTEQEYIQLSERLTRLGQRHAVLVAKEEQKAAERLTLVEELAAAGIDTTRPEEEIERLEKKLALEFQDSKASVDAFEMELNRAMGTGAPAVRESEAVQWQSVSPGKQSPAAGEDGDMDI